MLTWESRAHLQEKGDDLDRGHCICIPFPGGAHSFFWGSRLGWAQLGPESIGPSRTRRKSEGNYGSTTTTLRSVLLYPHRRDTTPPPLIHGGGLLLRPAPPLLVRRTRGSPPTVRLLVFAFLTPLDSGAAPVHRWLG